MLKVRCAPRNETNFLSRRLITRYEQLLDERMLHLGRRCERDKLNAITLWIICFVRQGGKWNYQRSASFHGMKLCPKNIHRNVIGWSIEKFYDTWILDNYIWDWSWGRKIRIFYIFTVSLRYIATDFYTD